ncbi:MAG TPA: tetratricopeptide repeat protein [Longimicrobium sp.]|nr:tetratricopeptide repeat protein [Longimicrobium sp.]
MASPSVARRPTRTEIDSDDALALRAAELAAWARRNVRFVVAAAVAALLAVGGYLAYNQSRTARAERAAARYLQVQAQYGNDTTAIVRELETFVRRFDGTPEAAEARLQLGETYLRRNQPAKTIELLRPLAGSGSPMAFQATMLTAAAQSASNQRDAAIRTYLSAADGAELLHQRVEALSEAALLREQAGDWRGAVELYRRMSEDTEEGSLERSVLELRIAEAEAKAGAAPAARR